MHYSNPQHIRDAILEFCQQNNIENNILQLRLVKSWEKLMGKTIAQMTTSIEFKQNTLLLCINNSALKQELFENRTQLLKKINTFMGKPLIKNIKIYG